MGDNLRESFALMETAHALCLFLVQATNHFRGLLLSNSEPAITVCDFGEKARLPRAMLAKCLITSAELSFGRVTTTTFCPAMF
jgi:hypothetical protein